MHNSTFIIIGTNINNTRHIYCTTLRQKGFFSCHGIKTYSVGRNRDKNMTTYEDLYHTVSTKVPRRDTDRVRA